MCGWEHCGHACRAPDRTPLSMYRPKTPITHDLYPTITRVPTSRSWMSVRCRPPSAAEGWLGFRGTDYIHGMGFELRGRAHVTRSPLMLALDANALDLFRSRGSASLHHIATQPLQVRRRATVAGRRRVGSKCLFFSIQSTSQVRLQRTPWAAGLGG